MLPVIAGLAIVVAVSAAITTVILLEAAATTLRLEGDVRLRTKLLTDQLDAMRSQIETCRERNQESNERLSTANLIIDSLPAVISQVATGPAYMVVYLPSRDAYSAHEIEQLEHRLTGPLLAYEQNIRDRFAWYYSGDILRRLVLLVRKEPTSIGQIDYEYHVDIADSHGEGGFLFDIDTYWHPECMGSPCPVTSDYMARYPNACVPMRCQVL